MSMKLIADAGGTKIEWVLLDDMGTVIERVTTTGHNAAQRSAVELPATIRTEAPMLLAHSEEIDDVYYYGAGCVGQRAEDVSRSLGSVFEKAGCHVESDMVGAARALCGHKEGIACILGTGSNSCHFDGNIITANVSPLGYILGDEGSGAVLGRRFIAMVMKNVFSEEVCHLFAIRFPEATCDEIIARVYRSERPAAYLASFVPFIRELIALPEIEEFVRGEFTRFLRMNVSAYPGVERLPIHFTGSVAWHFADTLRRAIAESGLTVGTICKSPTDGLIAWHRE